jgi:hypothetical protein
MWVKQNPAKQRDRKRNNFFHEKKSKDNIPIIFNIAQTDQPESWQIQYILFLLVIKSVCFILNTGASLEKPFLLSIFIDFIVM